MQRKKLLALPINKNREDIPVMQAIEEVTEERPWGNYKRTKHNYCYDAFVDNSTGDDVLIVDVFTPAPQSNFKFRLFQTSEKWFSVDCENKVSGLSLFWNVGEYSSNYFHPFNDNTNLVIDTYLKNNNQNSYIKEQGIKQISLFQDSIRKNRIQRKYDRIKESASQEMIEIRDIPKAVKNWIDETVMKDSRYMFYDYTGKKKTTARCSHCGKSIFIESPKRDQKVTCTECKKVCTAKPRKAYRNSSGFRDHKIVAYLQPLKNGDFCVRMLSVEYSFIDSEIPIKIITEQQRRIMEFTNGSLRERSVYSHDPTYAGGDWRREENIRYNRYNRYFIYPGTLNKIFRNQPNFNKYHIDYSKIARLCNQINIEGLYFSTNNIEFLMNLVNNKLTQLAQSLIICCGRNGSLYQIEQFKINEGSLRKGCGITKDDLRHLKIINPDITELNMYFEYKETGRRIDTAELKDFLTIAKAMGINSAFMKKVLKHSSLKQFCKFVKRLESEHYFSTKKYSWHNPYYDFVSDYKDYLSYIALLEYDLKDKNVLYPKDFKKAHDDADKIITDNEFSKGELPQIARQFEKYNKLFGYQTDKFIITPPTRHKDVKWEGRLLKHCVATYAQRIAKEETIILFIRRKEQPDEPYFTLNLNPQNYSIIQCRGFKNCGYPAEVKKFMDEWYKEKVEPLKARKKKCQKTTAA